MYKIKLPKISRLAVIIYDLLITIYTTQKEKNIENSTQKNEI